MVGSALRQTWPDNESLHNGVVRRLYKDIEKQVTTKAKIEIHRVE